MNEYENLFDECSVTPCRCGKIKVEQRDKDFLCDNGNCQVSETQVTVTFLDCPDAPVEETSMREVSAGCTPELYLMPGSPTVPTGGTTTVTAFVELGCEPTAGQSVDFSLSGSVPASLNPTYAETDPAGMANISFTAGDEEGTVTVTARSTVSYYTYSISASAGGVEETVHGPLLTKELNESVNIQIQKPDEVWTGTAVFDVYVDFVIIQNAHYEIDFQFFVTDLGDSNVKLIDGTATATQEVELSIGNSCWTFKDLNAPSPLNLFMHGYVAADTNDLSITFEVNEQADPFFEYVNCFVCNPDNPEDCNEPSGVLIYLFVSNAATNDVSIPLSEGTYSGAYNIFYLYHNYSITLHKEESTMAHYLNKNEMRNNNSDDESFRKARSVIESGLDKISVKENKN
jgi:hypothetical protein